MVLQRWRYANTLLGRVGDGDGDEDDTPEGAAAILHGELLYPMQVWYLVVTVIGVATIIHWSTAIWTRYRIWHLHRMRKQRARASRFVGSGELARAQRPIGTTQANPRRIPQAILTFSRIVWLRCTLPLPRTVRRLWGNGMSPNLLEGLVTLFYLTVLLTWEFVNTNNLDILFWSDRAAHLAAAQIPLLPALSSKNNVIGWLTGVTHEKLNLFHRGVARCILVLIWTHFWGRFTVGFTGTDDISQHTWQQFGAAAGLTYTIAVILSVRPIRAMAYETFYILHVILVCVFLVCAFVHTSGRGYEYYIWPAWIVWGFDRFCRAVRHLVLDVVSKPKVEPADATIELLTHDSLRLKVRRNVPLGWRAGQHCFLTLPSVSRWPLEAHPFSIASLPEKTDDDALPRRSSEGDELVFIVRARNGMTKRLQALALQGVSQVPVYLDGPYGNPPDLTPYVTSVLIAGGSGISYILPMFLELVRQVEARKACTRRIVFIWTIRDEAHLKWIMEHLTGALSSVPEFLGLDALEVLVHVTGRKTVVSMPPASLDSTSSSTQKDKFELVDMRSPSSATSQRMSDDLEKGSFELPGGLTVHRGRRPDVREILQEEFGVAEGPVSVNVSGPGSLIESVRSALAAPITGPLGVLRGLPTVYFHAENYTL